jgi:hypothetical protein
MFQLNDLVRLKRNFDPQNGLYKGAIGKIAGIVNEIDFSGDNNERPIVKYWVKFEQIEEPRAFNPESLDNVRHTPWHTQCGNN